MRSMDSLRQLLQDVHAAAGSFEGLLREALARNIPLHEVLGHVDFDDYPALAQEGDRLFLVLEFEDCSWLDVLSEVAGGDAQAQSVLNRASGWMAKFTVTQWRAQEHARHALSSAVSDPSNPRALRSAVDLARACLTEPEIEFALQCVVRQWPLRVIAQSDYIPADLQRTLLPQRGPWHELLDQVESDVGPSLAVDWITALLGVASTETTSDRRYLVIAAALRAPLGRSPTDPIRRVSHRSSPHAWLDIARRVGFPPSQALLVLLDAGMPVGLATIELSFAGWTDDEILSGLRENAIGPTRAIGELHKVGWNPARLVAALRDEGFLEPEIRELLRELGIPNKRVEALLCTDVSSTLQ